MDSFKVPPLRGPVNDYAKILDPSTKEKLNQILRQLKKESQGTELAILTLPNLEGLSIEQASFAVVDAWQLGGEKKDNGILLLISKKERRIRIEVGQGHEGNLTDAYAKRIIDEIMVPLMQSGDTNSSILLGVYQITQKIHPEIDVKHLFKGVQIDRSTFPSKGRARRSTKKITQLDRNPFHCSHQPHLWRARRLSWPTGGI